MLDVFRHEITETFYTWRGGAWIVVASLIFSLMAYLLLTDKELSLLDQGEMLLMLGKIIVTLGVIISSAIASSSITAEIESGTFESMLLTPITHRQIALQKLMSVITIWVVLYVVSIPYLVVLASGTNLCSSAIFYVGFYGTVSVAAVSSLSIAVSTRLDTSKNSMMASLMIVSILLVPPLFFSTLLMKTEFGLILDNVDPLSHVINSLDSVLVDNEQSLSQQAAHIWPNLLFMLGCLFLLFWYSKRFEVKGAAD
jgi:ABC-2 type transport system permease protein